MRLPCGKLPEPPEQGEPRKHTGRSLGNEGGPGHSRHPQGNHCNQKQIQQDIPHRGADEKIQGRSGIPQGGEDAGADVVKEKEGQPSGVDAQIGAGVGEDVSGGVEPLQQEPAEGEARPGEQETESQAGKEGGCDGGFELAEPPPSEELGNDHGAANIAAHRHSHKEHGNGVGGPYSGESPLAHKASGNHAVRNVVNLLEHDAHQHGKGKRRQGFGDVPLCHICNQTETSLMDGW